MGRTNGSLRESGAPSPASGIWKYREISLKFMGWVASTPHTSGCPPYHVATASSAQRKITSGGNRFGDH